MFVAASLGANFISTRNAPGVEIFVTPTLFHFMSVLLIAALMLIPKHGLLSLGGLLLVLGIIGIIYCILIIGRMRRHPNEVSIDLRHWFWHAILPMIGYSVIVGVSLWLMSGDLTALSGIAISEILLLIIGVWNAWVLIVWIVQNSGS
jgi:hypothetical protein